MCRRQCQSWWSPSASRRLPEYGIQIITAVLKNGIITDFTFQIGAETAGADNVAVSNDEIDSYSLFLYNGDNPNAPGVSVGIDSAGSTTAPLTYIDLAIGQINNQRSE